MKLLHIYALPEAYPSRTLKISNHLIESLQSANENLEVSELNLLNEDLPEVYGSGSVAKYQTLGGVELNGEVKTEWDRMLEYAHHFNAHDYFVLTLPMWNFSLPYKIKQYIDVIVQPGVMFQFTENGPQGMLSGKKMFCVSTRGSDYSAPPMNQYDFVEPYIRSIFGFVGIYDITFINAQPLDIDPNLAEIKINEAMAQASSLANGL